MKKQVIEHAGIPVGIAVPDRDQLRFIAVKFQVIDLDERRFASVKDLKDTIHAHLTSADLMAA